MKNKKAFTLLELIFSIVILAIIVSSVGVMIGMLAKEDRQTFNNSLTKIDFETTRLFLESKIKNDSNLLLLSYAGNNIYYDNDLLNENVSSFQKNINPSYVSLNICIKYSENFCTTIYIKK